jgi:hypothetical protein
MTICEANNHRLEFQECNNGEICWKCLDCGETITQYQDCLGG